MTMDTQTRPATGAALLGAAAVLIWNDVADEGRELFYRWHDKEHIPERLAIPGFRRGRRYGRPGHSPEWLTMYEADDVAVLTSSAYLARLNAPTPLTQRALPHFRNTARAVCRLVASCGSSSGGHVLAIRLDVPGGAAERLSEQVETSVFPAALATTGVIACHLYASDREASHIDTAESRTRRFDVPDCVLLVEASTQQAAEAMRSIVDAPVLRSLGISVRDGAAYSLEICRLHGPASVH
jgi:hypothetical protein